MNRSPLLPIFLIVLVDVLGLTIILPLLPFYAEHLGASATVVGLLISSYAFCQLIAGPILGNLSDRSFITVTPATPPEQSWPASPSKTV